jgi:hypothetical protein
VLPACPQKNFLCLFRPAKQPVMMPRHFWGATRVSTAATWGNIFMMDYQRLHEEVYRWDVVVALMRDHGDTLTQYCRT